LNFRLSRLTAARYTFRVKKLILFALAFLVGCAAHRSQKSTVESPDSAFSHLATDYLTGYLAWRPQIGTALGLHQHDGKITDFSQGSLDREFVRLKFFKHRLAQLDTNHLSAESLYDYRILRAAVQREIFTFEEMKSYWLNPMTYAGVLDVNIYIKRDFAPLEDRVRSIIAILSQAPNIITAAQVNLTEVLPRPFVETALEQASGSIDFLRKDLVEALKPVNNQELMAQFDTANKRAIDALQTYVSFLKTQRLPKANDAYALGQDNYLKLLQTGELVNLPINRLLDLGLRELHRLQRVFAETAKEIDPTKSPVEVFQSIQKEHPSAQNLIPDTAKGLEMIRQFVIDHRIITIPSPVRAQVAETPQFLRSTSFASMDTPGPFETKATEAYYYVTPVEPDWTPQQAEEWLSAFNYYDIEVTSIHEAYPGHYVQFLCLNASPATRLEKIFAGYAFTEGWAHYSEQMMLDEGFGAPSSGTPTREEQIRTAKYRLAQTDEALLRVCRFCVSVQMHCQGMTVDGATRFFEENCHYQPKPARQEAIRGTFDPEYLYYTLGKLEILKLRADYQRQEGPNFRVQKFHDELLRHGAPPIRLLREVLLKDASLWPQVL
jgi:uncharacterized protein (DUF885 family)